MSDSLFNRLRKLSESDLYSFHMPGHKRLMDDMDIYSMDISEITGFDNLHFPRDILLTAQQKAADLYGADETFYLINGSTSGILSAVSAINNGKKMLIPRNSHFSVYHAAYLNDIELEYIYPKYDEETGIAHGVAVSEISEKLKNDPDIGAVLVTSPTYEGILSDITEIAKITNEYNIVLIVDQAHGAHCGFHPAFSDNAVRQGADIVIHSMHKTLPSLTQTALLHVNGNRVNRNRLKRFLRIYQSSSPSYPLMASIERCLEIVKNESKFSLQKMIACRNRLIDRAGQLIHFTIPKGINNIAIDPCKLIILTKGITGKKLAKILREKYLLEMEMATDNYVIAIITMMDEVEGFERLADALCEIDRELPVIAEAKPINLTITHQPEKVKSIKEAYDGEITEVPLIEAEGQIAAEFAFTYPPGIPLIVPGEKINSHTIDLLREQGDTFWISR